MGVFNADHGIFLSVWHCSNLYVIIYLFGYKVAVLLISGKEVIGRTVG